MRHRVHVKQDPPPPLPSQWAQLHYDSLADLPVVGLDEQQVVHDDLQGTTVWLGCYDSQGLAASPSQRGGDGCSAGLRDGHEVKSKEEQGSSWDYIELKLGQ